jgi:hypothetical protein
LDHAIFYIPDNSHRNGFRRMKRSGWLLLFMTLLGQGTGWLLQKILWIRVEKIR